MKVALFITCLTDNYYPRAAIAAVKVLEHLGHAVACPLSQTCCGQPMFNNGFQDEARRLAQHTIEVFRDYDTVISPSGSCAAMIREHYPRLFAEDSVPRRQAERLAARTYEFVEFLATVSCVDLGALGVRWPGRATWHSGCHLRALGGADRGPQLAAQVAGLEVVQARDAQQCCGFGGTFAVQQSDISGAMVRHKADCLAETGANTLICNEAGCAMNIAGALHRRRQPMRVLSLAEIIAEGLGLLPRDERP